MGDITNHIHDVIFCYHEYERTMPLIIALQMHDSEFQWFAYYTYLIWCVYIYILYFIYPRFCQITYMILYHLQIFPKPTRFKNVWQDCKELLSKTSSKLQPMVDQDVQRDVVAWHISTMRMCFFQMPPMDFGGFPVCLWSYLTRILWFAEVTHWLLIISTYFFISYIDVILQLGCCWLNLNIEILWLWLTSYVFFY